MSLRVVLHLLSVLGLLQKGLTALIQTQPTVTAAVGEEAHLRCQLMETEDVVQVAWQKLSNQTGETLANYTSKNSLKVNPAFRDKVQITDAGLQNSSIVIMNVTEEDEGCYHCLFYSDPEGALTGSTCLKVYELHEPVLLVRESVVSCSATGRPAPTVTLRVLRGDVRFSNYRSVRVDNTNATVTVTTTASMTRSHDDSAEVGCSARVLSALEKVNKTIPADRRSDRRSSDDDNPQTNIASASAAAGCLAAVATVLIVQKRKRSQQHRDCEEKETPPKPTEGTDETTTPAIPEESEHVRPEMSTLKKQQGSQSKSRISDRKKSARAVVITVNYWHRATVENSDKTVGTE